MNLVSSRRFLIADYVIYSGAFLSVSRDVVLAFSGILFHFYTSQRNFYAFSRVSKLAE